MFLNIALKYVAEGKKNSQVTRVRTGKRLGLLHLGANLIECLLSVTRN